MHIYLSITCTIITMLLLVQYFEVHSQIDGVSTEECHEVVCMSSSRMFLI